MALLETDGTQERRTCLDPVIGSVLLKEIVGAHPLSLSFLLDHGQWKVDYEMADSTLASFSTVVSRKLLLSEAQTRVLLPFVFV